VRRFAVAVLVLGLACASARAAEKSPLDIYRAGNYEGAIAAGEAAGTGEGLAVAARAALADANLRETPCLSCLQRAEALAHRSIALDAMHPEAFVYLAAALGYEARIVGVLRARFGGYPEQAKDAIDRALALTPEDSWTLAAAGAWHTEIVRNGGSLLARALYGARIDLGTDYFRRAIAADPGNLVIRFQYALSLSGYDFDRYKDEALGHLREAAKLEPRTAYESTIKERAGGLLDLIKANRQADYLALVTRYQGYP
jgi:tetratricopeptide (TPR) repeat protein